jgi:hypothetical protein
MTASPKSNQGQECNTEKFIENNTLAKLASSTVSVQEITIDVGKTLVPSSAIMA